MARRKKNNISKEDISLKKQKLEALDKEWNLLNKISKEWETLELKKAKGKTYDQQRLNYLNSEYGSLNKLEQKITRIGNQYNKLNEEVSEFNKEVGASLEHFEDLDASLISFANGIGKIPGIYNALNKKVDVTKKTVGSIAHIIQNSSDLTEQQSQVAIDAANAYSGITVSLAEAQKQLLKGKINQSEYNQLIIQATDNFDELIDAIDNSTESGRQLKKILSKAKEETDNLTAAAKKSEEKLSALENVGDNFASSGIPLANEFTNVIKSIGNNGKGAALAFAALGAAAGNILARTLPGLADMNAKLKAQNDIIEEQINLRKQLAEYGVEQQFIPQRIETERFSNEIERQMQVNKLAVEGTFIPAKISQERYQNEIDSQNTINRAIIDAQYAAQKAAISFNASLQSGAAQFKAAAKTALFGDELKNTKYAASQLQLAGVSAEQIVQSMNAVSETMGQMPTQELAEDMAVFSRRTGAAVEDVAAIANSMNLIEGSSLETSLNLQAGIKAMAKRSGLSFSNLMKGISSASKKMVEYGITNSQQLAKQVAYAQSIGASFDAIADAGRNMVVNYKDSIKGEMMLSLRLGRRIDLSEARQKFYQGDQAGAIEAIRAQGLTPDDLKDYFTADFAKQALGGMDITTILQASTRTGKDAGDLTAESIENGNDKFLKKYTKAQAELSAKEAVISANTAVIDAKLSQKITDAYLRSPGYLQYQQNLNDLAQQQANLTSQITDAWLNSKGNRDYQFNLLELQKQQATLNSNITQAFYKTKEYQQFLVEQERLSVRRQFTENLIPTLGTIGGGLGGYALGNMMFGNGGGGLMSMFGKGTPTTGTTTGAGAGGFMMMGTQTGASFGTNLAGAAGSAATITGGVLTALTSGMEEWSKNKQMGISMGENIGRTTTKAISSGAGAWGGASLGAAIGTAIFPGIGTVIGGFLGGWLGGKGGGALGDAVNDGIWGDKQERIKRTQEAQLNAQNQLQKQTSLGQQIDINYYKKVLDLNQQQVDQLQKYNNTQAIAPDWYKQGPGWLNQLGPKGPQTYLGSGLNLMPETYQGDEDSPFGRKIEKYFDSKTNKFSYDIKKVEESEYKEWYESTTGKKWTKETADKAKAAAKGPEGKIKVLSPEMQKVFTASIGKQDEQLLAEYDDKLRDLKIEKQNKLLLTPNEKLSSKEIAEKTAATAEANKTIQAALQSAVEERKREMEFFHVKDLSDISPAMEQMYKNFSKFRSGNQTSEISYSSDKSSGTFNALGNFDIKTSTLNPDNQTKSVQTGTANALNPYSNSPALSVSMWGDGGGYFAKLNEILELTQKQADTRGIIHLNAFNAIKTSIDLFKTDVAKNIKDTKDSIVGAINRLFVITKLNASGKAQGKLNEIATGALSDISGFVNIATGYGGVFDNTTPVPTTPAPETTTTKVKNAQGTKNFKGGLSWVGEEGPELMYVPQSASIVPNGDSKSIAAGNLSLLSKWGIPGFEDGKETESNTILSDASGIFSENLLSNIPDNLLKGNKTTNNNQNFLGNSFAQYKKKQTLIGRQGTYLGQSKYGTNNLLDDLIELTKTIQQYTVLNYLKQNDIEEAITKSGEPKKTGTTGTNKIVNTTNTGATKTGTSAGVTKTGKNTTQNPATAGMKPAGQYNMGNTVPQWTAPQTITPQTNVNPFNPLNVIKGHAKGTTSSEGGFSMVGEKGPELMYVPQSAAIVPNGDTNKIKSGDTSILSKWNIPGYATGKKPKGNISLPGFEEGKTAGEGEHEELPELTFKKDPIAWFQHHVTPILEAGSAFKDSNAFLVGHLAYALGGPEYSTITQTSTQREWENVHGAQKNIQFWFEHIPHLVHEVKSLKEIGAANSTADAINLMLRQSVSSGIKTIKGGPAAWGKTLWENWRHSEIGIKNIRHYGPHSNPLDIADGGKQAQQILKESEAGQSIIKTGAKTAEETKGLIKGAETEGSIATKAGIEGTEAAIAAEAKGVAHMGVGALLTMAEQVYNLGKGFDDVGAIKALNTQVVDKVKYDDLKQDYAGWTYGGNYVANIKEPVSVGDGTIKMVDSIYKDSQGYARRRKDNSFISSEKPASDGTMVLSGFQNFAGNAFDSLDYMLGNLPRFFTNMSGMTIPGLSGGDIARLRSAYYTQTGELNPTNEKLADWAINHEKLLSYNSGMDTGGSRRDMGDIVKVVKLWREGKVKQTYWPIELGKGIWNLTKTVGSSIGSGISTLIQHPELVANGVIDKVTNVAKSISKTIAPVVGAMSSFGNIAMKKVKDVGSTAFNYVKTGLGTGFTTAKNTASNLWQGAKSVGTGVVQGAKNLGGKAITTVKNIGSSIASGASTAWNTTKNLGGKAMDWVSSWFATGTESAPGGLSMVGEKGPELMYVPQSAAIVPNGDTRKIQNGDTSKLSKWGIPGFEGGKEGPGEGNGGAHGGGGEHGGGEHHGVNWTDAGISTLNVMGSRGFNPVALYHLLHSTGALGHEKSDVYSEKKESANKVLGMTEMASLYLPEKLGTDIFGKNTFGKSMFGHGSHMEGHLHDGDWEKGIFEKFVASAEENVPMLKKSYEELKLAGTLRSSDIFTNFEKFKILLTEETPALLKTLSTGTFAAIRNPGAALKAMGEGYLEGIASEPMAIAAAVISAGQASQDTYTQMQGTGGNVSTTKADVGNWTASLGANMYDKINDWVTFGLLDKVVGSTTGLTLPVEGIDGRQTQILRGIYHTSHPEEKWGAYVDNDELIEWVVANYKSLSKMEDVKPIADKVVDYAKRKGISVSYGKMVEAEVNQDVSNKITEAKKPLLDLFAQKRVLEQSINASVWQKMVKNNPSLANADIDAAMMDNMIRMHMDFSQMQQLSDINAKIKAQKGITEKNKSQIVAEGNKRRAQAELDAQELASISYGLYDIPDLPGFEEAKKQQQQNRNTISSNYRFIQQAKQEKTNKKPTINKKSTVATTNTKAANEKQINAIKKWVNGYATGVDSAPGGPALVGEKGTEMMLHGGMASLIGLGGPEIMNIPKGAEILPNSKLQKMPTFQEGTTGATMAMMNANTQQMVQMANIIADAINNKQTNDQPQNINLVVDGRQLTNVLYRRNQNRTGMRPNDLV